MPDDAEDANNALLRGVVLCSTSLSQDLRDKLNDLARSMGAVHRLDLTADVTHLIVGNIDTPKCRHTAKERPDIHVLKPEWIHAIRKSYMEDQDIDVDALVQEHRLPVFYNLHISVTGFEDIEERQQIIEKIRSNGAYYHGDLTREVTHLIVAKPKGAKYERAQSWTIKTTSLKWLEESLDRGMAVDESLYHPLMPLEDQGRGAYVRGYERPPPPLGKRRRGESAITSKEENGKRKMRRTASAKLADHSQNMMTSFMSHGGEEPSEVANDQWTEAQHAATPSRSITPPGRPNGASRHTSWEGVAAPREEEPGLFSGILCLVHGHDEKKATKIDTIITSNGGQTTRSADILRAAQNGDSSQHKVLILPSEWTSTNKGSLPEVPAETWLVTEWWLERCIKQKMIVDPDHDILSQPHLSLPIDDFKGLTIATSGMGHDVLHISRVVRLAGASYDEMLVPRTSFLIVPGAATNSEKISYAAKHKIPVVLDTWLYSSLQHVRMMPPSDFVVAGQSKQSLDRSSARDASIAPPQDKRRDVPSAQRLSAIRKRNIATSLHLYQSGPVQPAQPQPAESKRIGPFIEEDEDEAPPAYKTHDPQELEEKRYVPSDDPPPVAADDYIVTTDITQPKQPLQSIPPEVNTIRKQSRSTPSGDVDIRSNSSSVRKDAQQAEPAEDENVDAMANQVRLSGEIKSLLERQHSHSGPSPAEQPAKGRWRKDKKLGRAPSYASGSSTSVSFRQHPSMDTANPGSLTNLMEGEAPAPSQQVTYETPEAQEYRAKMSKKMGTRLMDDNIGTRVESPGLVRDVDASDSTGVGGRVRGRQRMAKNAV